MPLSAGARLGPYEILGPIGAGGMGEVYRARDTRLGRDVAVKVLPETFAADSGRLRRFEREARAASALNHPHILTVHDVGTEGGRPFLVTELLEGRTLREALLDGARPVASALDCATQIARGLAAAHEAGVVHRDLKPENLFLTRQGTVKILDFGLARLADPRAEGPSESETLSRETEAGTVLGTVGYMAPEQVRGETADAASDVFSFGCVLYEMLTGERAFARATAPETMTAILREEPEPLADRRPETPPVVGRLLERCLAKDKGARLRSGRELLAVLDVTGTAASAPRVQGPAAAVPGRASRRAALPWLAAGALGGAALAATALVGLRPGGGSREGTTPIVASLTLPSGPGSLASAIGAADVALSPDGSRLVYGGVGTDGRRSLWVRDLDSESPRELPGTTNAEAPFWSPDGRSLGFFAEGRLRRTTVDSGAVQTLCDAASPYPSGSWSARDVILFTQAGSIHRIAAAGGTAQVVAEPDPAQERTLRFPSFLPDGDRFLFVARRREGPHRVYVRSLSGKEPPRLVHEGRSRTEFVRGRLLFVRDGVLLAQAVDEGSLQPVGDPRPVAPRIFNHAASGRASFSASPRGVLAYVTASGTPTELVWKDRRGRMLERLTEAGRYIGVAPSPDGRRVAVEIEDEETNEHAVWVLDPARGTRSRLTKPPHDSHHPAWSPDGREIAYSSDRSGRWVAYAGRADGLGGERLVERRADVPVSYPRQWLRDGTLMVTARRSDAEPYTLWLLPPASGEPARPLVEGIWGAVSPNGRWLAVAAGTDGRSRIHVLPFPALDTRWEVSGADGGSWPQWRADGRELFYVSDTRRLMSVAVREGSRFEATPPEPLFALRPAGDGGQSYPSDFAASGDGQRFLVCQVPEHAAMHPVTLVSDFQALLRRR